ncbi:MAG: hypothetical protein DRI71_06670 [Bacteroidetes bacterium]|nr:MAG: hypothetical protein DRI71_06670 [Bacteroidota bacterium]
METGIVNKIMIGKEMIPDGVMAFTVGHFYLKKSIQISKVLEVVDQEGIRWLEVYVKKTADQDGLLYLWWKISNVLRIQYHINFND